VDENSVLVQQRQPVEQPKFPLGSFVHTFAGVQDEWPTHGCGRSAGVKVSTERRRMCPAIPLEHSHREVASPQFGPKEIMMADSCDPAEQIADCAPPQPHIPGHGFVQRDDFGKCAMYVFSPLDVIPIRRIGEAREEREVQMIVSVD
jgi:hypothetical protein